MRFGIQWSLPEPCEAWAFKFNGRVSDSTNSRNSHPEIDDILCEEFHEVFHLAWYSLQHFSSFGTMPWILSRYNPLKGSLSQAADVWSAVAHLAESFNKMLFKQELFDVKQAKELLRNVCVQKLATYEMLVFDSIHKMSFAALHCYVWRDYKDEIQRRARTLYSRISTKPKTARKSFLLFSWILENLRTISDEINSKWLRPICQARQQTFRHLKRFKNCLYIPFILSPSILFIPLPSRSKQFSRKHRIQWLIIIYSNVGSEWKAELSSHKN